MINTVRAKKSLGQHFLNDKNIAQRIVDSLSGNTNSVLEVGPGMGVLTELLLQRTDITTYAAEIDKESIAYLQTKFPTLGNRLIAGDFLQLDLTKLFSENFSVIGNFPYNISSQIFFKILDCRNQIPEAVGMIQKEVAERIACAPGKKTYGILSVLLQAFYDIEYLFTVHEHVFSPPPKDIRYRKKLVAIRLKFHRFFCQARKLFARQLLFVSCQPLPEFDYDNPIF